MKRPTMLVKAALRDAELDLDLSVERDVQCIERRCKHEGFSFLTITLPQLSDALERGIEAGTFSCPTSFSRHGSLPRFMGGFFKRVFDKDGRLLPDSCPYAVKWIRQICRFFKKPETDCSPKRVALATEHFLEVEGELRRMTSQVERKDNFLDQVAGIIWAQVFPELDNNDLVCHHGPGVTADRFLSNERNRIRWWNHRSELTFPSDLHCYPNYGYAAEAGINGEGTSSVEGPEYLTIRDELPVRIVFVPKTLTAPRVIAIEPSHMQYMQQSVKDYVYERIEGHSLTKRSIRFSDQSFNQRLAYRSSMDKRLATLDLKDASDRVHLHLVQRIFKTSGLLPFLEDARSLHATLPDGRNIVLFKYASMGSALCFPVEAMVFYTLIQSAMHQLDGRRPSSRSIRDYSRKIDIYGDDIIIPVEYTDVVVNYLEAYALKVNVNKSFLLSNFRESCGADYYKGVPVNPVYARKVPHDNLRHWGAEDVMSWNATADLCYLTGMWTTAQAIRDLLSRVVRRTIPKTRKLGSGIAHLSLLYTTHLRWNGDLQCFKQKRLHYDPIKRKDSIDGYALACLNKWGYSVSSSTSQWTGTYRDYGKCKQLHDAILSERDRSHSKCRLGHRDPNVDARFDDCSICGLPGLGSIGGENSPFLPGLAPGCECSSQESTQPGVRSEDFHNCGSLTPSHDPLAYLSGRSEGLDFLSSTKRGCFKSKSRWVSLDG